MKRFVVVSLLLALLGAGAAALWLAPPEAAAVVEPSREAPQAAAVDAAPATPLLDPTRLRAARYIAAASGETPEFNQVSVEQDLALASEVLGSDGFVLFAAGPDHPTVQVLAETPEPDPVVRALASLFAPRGGRDASYRAPQIAVDAPATAANVAEAIRIATAQPGPPLLLYLAGHGLQGDVAARNTVGFWARSSLAVRDFAEQLRRSKRPVRIVATTCFSGGLAELVFEGANPKAGPAATTTCGLFAAPWDLEASGCDPNPDRAAQEGYALHFLHALRRQDRDGQPLPTEAIDFDGDGHVSLLEAHSRARIASAGPDVPTTTSERWLEHLVPDVPARSDATGPPEEDAVISALVARVGESDPARTLDALEVEIDKTQRRLARAQDAEERAFRIASAEFLARWPVLDDPWHPAFGATLSANHTAIERLLETSDAYATYLQTQAKVDELANAVADLRVDAAPLERLLRAQDFRARAAALQRRGGRGFARFEALLACERHIVAPGG